MVRLARPFIRRPASDAVGDVLLRSAAGWDRLAAGTSTHVLTANGAATLPSWQEAAGGGGGGVAMFDAVVAPSGGDYTGPEAAIAAGKTKLFVRNGTYVLTDTIDASDGMVIVGESRDGVIFDASGCTVGIDIGGGIEFSLTGTSPYHAGTVAVNGASPSDPTEVAGSSTEWVDTAWIESGHCIIIYCTGADLVDSVTSNTVLNVQNGFPGRNNGSLYYCTFPCTKNVTLRNLTISGASSKNLYLSYAYNCLVEDVVLLNSGGYGMHVEYAANCSFNRVWSKYCTEQCVYCGNASGVDTGMVGFNNILTEVKAIGGASEGIRVNGGWNCCEWRHCGAYSCGTNGFDAYSADTDPERTSWSKLLFFEAFGNGNIGVTFSKGVENIVTGIIANNNATDASIGGSLTAQNAHNT